MQTLHVNGYDMAYLDVGEAGRTPPLVCVHGSLNDFRVWGCVIGPLSKKHRVIAVSLRHFFPERWDGKGDTYSIDQHVDDVIAFIEKLNAGPVDLMGHSRGGHIAFRVAQQRPDLLRKLILAEPGGELDATLDPDYTRRPLAAAGAFHGIGREDRGRRRRRRPHRFCRHAGGRRPLAAVPPLMKQPLRDNAYTLIGQVRDNRPPFLKADAESISMPTLFIGGARTKGLLPKVLHALAAHVPNSRTGDDPEHDTSDVRAGAAGIFRGRAGFPGGLTMQTIGSTNTTCPISKSARVRRWSASMAR